MITNNQFSDSQWQQWVNESQCRNAPDFEIWLKNKQSVKIPYAELRNIWIKNYSPTTATGQPASLTTKAVNTTTPSSVPTSIHPSTASGSLVKPELLTLNPLEKLQECYSKLDAEKVKINSSLKKPEDQMALIGFVSLVGSLRKGHHSRTAEDVEKAFNSLPFMVQNNAVVKQAKELALNVVKTSEKSVSSSSSSTSSADKREKEQVIEAGKLASPESQKKPLLSEYFVRTLTGKTIPIEVDRDLSTGMQIKQIIEQKEGIKPWQMRLVFAGNLLKNDETLAELSKRVHVDIPACSSGVLQMILSHDNTTVEEFAKCVDLKKFDGFSSLSEEEINKAKKLGIQFNIVTDETMKKGPISIPQESSVITACSSGKNRSQVAERVFHQMGLKTLGILAADTAVNLEADFPNFADTKDDHNSSATNFQACFGQAKKPQIGADTLPDFIDSEQELADARAFYKQYFQHLEAPVHFIAFGQSVLPIVRRLLEKGKSLPEMSLQGFTVTYLPWADEIANPAKGVEKCSVEAYTQFAQKLQNCFKIR